MIIKLKENYKQNQLKELITNLESQGLKIEQINSKNTHILTVIGDCYAVDVENLKRFDCVESISRIQKPYRLVGREYQPKDTIIKEESAKIGGGYFTFIAGPCAVENEKQIIEIAQNVKKVGATMLRGGAYKPRTSPYTFQGLQKEGLNFLLLAKRETGLPIVSEIMEVREIDDFCDVDVLQIGARNMQNYELLKEVGKLGKTVLLKRGFGNSIEEWLQSAEYLMVSGCKNIILCERGIKTFEPQTKTTLDLSGLPLLKELTHLPVIVDPSHASGVSRFVKPLSLASVGAGADGLMIEVHNDPKSAKCDGAQAVTVEQFTDIVNSVKEILPVCKKRLS